MAAPKKRTPGVPKTQTSSAPLKNKGGKAAKRVVRIISRYSTKGEGRGVLREARAAGRTPFGVSSQNRKNVYRAGRQVKAELGPKAAARFNKAVAKVEANQTKARKRNTKTYKAATKSSSAGRSIMPVAKPKGRTIGKQQMAKKRPSGPTGKRLS